ncbi:unnamed protein product [Paramecium sonneborni]|uniref:Transmembrane protein n=1 Tax=Paramecium sonneborni TaxID=65129 RepID=A0A8S1NF79_9CILI|nr:unnamed protein product [Paramecium sonneborni]
MMKFMILVLYTLIVVIDSCSKIVSKKFYITSTVNEVIKIPLKQLFIDTNFDSITITPKTNEIQVAGPLQLLEQFDIDGLSNTQTISFKMQKSTKSRNPIHMMTILRKSEEQYYFGLNSNLYSTIPLIEVIQPTFQKEKQCFDIAQIDILIITECNDEQEDFFSIYSIATGLFTYLPISKFNQGLRKLDLIDNYLFRGTEDKLEVYSQQDGLIQHLSTLDSQKMQQLLQKESFQLQIINFQTHTDMQVSLLNKSGEIILIKFNNNLWELISYIQTQISDGYGYDYDIYTNAYVIYSQTELYFKSQNNQQFTIPLTLNSQSQVYLQKDWIILFEDQSIILYSQKLEKIYTYQLEDSQFYISTNPYQNGFLLISNTQFKHFVINNEQSLQFSSLNIPIMDDYSSVIVSQNSTCKVKVFYKVVEIQSKNIFYQQESSGLISDSINLDDPQVKFLPVFQGSNLQYHFQPNNIIDLNVEKLKHFKIDEVLETQEIIYRKIFSQINSSLVQLIQQEKNLQLSGYICQQNNDTNLTCQRNFKSKAFQKLTNSENEIWWINKDSLFLAIQKFYSVIIYCIQSEAQQFEELIELTQDEKVQKIVTDGLHLFIQTEKSILIYKISRQNKAKYITKIQEVGQIYSSTAQNDLLFVETDDTLYIYSIEYEKITLIWFTEIRNDFVERNLLISSTHFVRFIRMKNEEFYSADVYNIENLNNIYFEKKLDLDGQYKFDLSSIQINIKTNFIYVLAQKNSAKSQEIQIYKISEICLNSMFLKIDTVEAVQFSTTSNYFITTEVIDNQQILKNYYINGDYFIQFQIKQDYNQIEYSQKINLNFSVTNNAQIKIIDNSPAFIINRGIKMFRTLESVNLTYHSDKVEIHCLSLNESWYSGQAFEINQIDGLDKLKYLKTLFQQVDILEVSPIIKEFNDKTIVQLWTHKIILFSKSDLSKSFEYQLDETYTFTNIFFIEKDHLYVEALMDNQVFLRVIQCQKQICELLKEKLQLQDRPEKAYLHQQNFFYIKNRHIKVFDINNQPLNVSQFLLFDEFSVSDQALFVDMIHIKDNYYQFISATHQGNVEFYTKQISKTQSYNLSQTFDINFYLKMENLFLKPDSVCVGFFLTESQIILIFSNTASYSFLFINNCSTDNTCLVQQFELYRIFQQFGSWMISDQYPIGYYSNEILSLIFRAETYSELFIYDLKNYKKNKKEPYTIIAHLTATYSPKKQGFYPIQSFVYQYDDQLYLLSNAKNKNSLYLYLLDRTPQLCINSKEVNQIVKFALSNPYSTTQISLKISISDDNPNHFNMVY